MNDTATVVGQVFVGPGDGIVAHRQRRFPAGNALPPIANQDLFVRRPTRWGPVEPQAMERGYGGRRIAPAFGSKREAAGGEQGEVIRAKIKSHSRASVVA